MWSQHEDEGKGCYSSGVRKSGTVYRSERKELQGRRSHSALYATGQQERSAAVVELRRELAKKAVTEYGITLSETARQPGVTANAVSYMLKQAGKRIPDKSCG